jgi:hypothetical protein
MRIIVAGSRSVLDEQVRDALARCPWVGFVSAVVSGTAKGADEFGERWAEQHNITVVKYPADWEKYGKKAGPLRNKLMAENADGLVAVWDGESRGTRSMIELARRLGLRVFVLETSSGKVSDCAATGPLALRWEAAEERAGILEFAGGLSRREAERQAGIEHTGASSGARE